MGTPRGTEVTWLAEQRVTIGRAPDKDVALTWDRAVGKLHAVLEPFGTEWTIRDLDSLNGTLVGGERLAREHVLRSGEEMTVGNTKLVYRQLGAEALASTELAPSSSDESTPPAPPELTKTERLILRELCRPMLEGRRFSSPRTVSAIAKSLDRHENTVKFHLENLYSKYDVHADKVENRRVELANRALERGPLGPDEVGGDRS